MLRSLVALLSMAAALSGCSPSPESATAASVKPPASSPQPTQQGPVLSCKWSDLEHVVASLSSTEAERVCRTMEAALGRLPSVASANKLSKLIFIIRVDNGSDLAPRDIARQVMDVVEARDALTDEARMDETFETLAKIHVTSGGRVSPRDMNIALRAAGPLARTMNQDALFATSFYILQEKKALGQ